MTGPIVIEREWLERCIAKNMSQAEMAEAAGCGKTTICMRLRLFGLPHHSRRDGQACLWHDRDWLWQKRMVEKLDMSAMAKLAGCAKATIQAELARHGFGKGNIHHKAKPEPAQASAPVDAWEEPIIDCLTCKFDKTDCTGCPMDR